MVIALRIWLVLVFLANLGGLIYLATSLDAIVANYPRLSYGLATLLLLCGLASLAAVVLIWRWKRSGVYLVTAAYGVMLAANLYYQAPLAHTVLGPIGLVVLFALMWPSRKSFGAGAG